MLSGEREGRPAPVVGSGSGCGGGGGGGGQASDVVENESEEEGEGAAKRASVGERRNERASERRAVGDGGWRRCKQEGWLHLHRTRLHKGQGLRRAISATPTSYSLFARVPTFSEAYYLLSSIEQRNAYCGTRKAPGNTAR